MPLPAGIAPYCKLGDLNSDGKLDLICAGNQSAPFQVAVFLGNGDGTFRSSIISSFQDAISSTQPAVAAIADLNRDGTPDVVISSPESNQIFPLLGDGKGHLTAAPTLFSPGAVLQARVLDLNGDGHLDLVGQGTYGNNGGLPRAW